MKFRWAGEVSQPTDYDRAADIRDSIAPLSVGEGEGIVITEDYATVWLPSAEGGIFLRLTGSNEEVFPLMPLIEASMWSEPHFEYQVDQPNFVLFDPAFDYDTHLEYLEISTKPGRYKVSTFKQEIEGIRMLIYRLRAL